jgi:outer membrane protein TolC
MKITKDQTVAAFAGVSPFTGEPETYPAGTANPPVPLMGSQSQFLTAVTVQRPRNLDKVVAAVLREAEFAAAKTREQMSDLQRTLEIQLDQAYRDFEQARREAATSETNISAAEENLRIEEDQYKAGLARTTDVLDAESVLAESRFALVNQNYNVYLKQGIILSTAGEDLPAFFVAVREH